MNLSQSKAAIPALDQELAAALKAMDQSFQVRLIATFAPNLACAPAEAQAAQWLTENYPDFDQFPVRDGETTIGVLLRQSDYGDKSVGDVMLPLSERVIVSADMPIADLIPELRESHYRLVLRGDRIDGLVTQSDLLKLPVRMLIFGLISHLESGLRALVRQRAAWPMWLELLHQDRQKEVRKEVRKLERARLEPDPLEVSNFSDVVNILAAQPDLGDDFWERADSVRLLRNDVAHAKTYIASADDVHQFVGRFNGIRDLTDRVSRVLQD